MPDGLAENHWANRNRLALDRLHAFRTTDQGIDTKPKRWNEITPLKPKLARLLCCPMCHSDLILNANQRTGTEIQEGTLSCKDCGTSYPVTRGIPRFVTSDTYVRSFSAEWNIFSKTQLDSGEIMETLDSFVKKTGLRPVDLAACKILEAGCGMGRFLDVVSRAPKSIVVGFDLSLAVDAAYENVGRRSNVHILQADIMRPPFRDESFDFVYSLGAIHHTPDPKQAFLRLVPLVKRGGQIAVWVYRRYSRPPISDFYRIATSRMSWSAVLAISRLLSRLHSIQRRWRYLLVLIPISEHIDPNRRLLDTLDWYSPRYQFKFVWNDVTQWFRDAKLSHIRTLSFPISVRGRK